MLNSEPALWVLDTSVLINLLCMPEPLLLLGYLRSPVVVAAITAREVKRLDHPLRRGLDPTVEIQKIAAVEELTSDEWMVFEEIVGSPSPNDLGDGEAAALAICDKRNGASLVDDQKCIRVAQARTPQIPCRTTIDLIRHCVAKGLPKGEAAQSIREARSLARMRVPAEHRVWVEALLA